MQQGLAARKAKKKRSYEEDSEQDFLVTKHKEESTDHGTLIKGTAQWSVGNTSSLLPPSTLAEIAATINDEEPKETEEKPRVVLEGLTWVSDVLFLS